MPPTTERISATEAELAAAFDRWYRDNRSNPDDFVRIDTDESLGEAAAKTLIDYLTEQ